MFVATIGSQRKRGLVAAAGGRAPVIEPSGARSHLRAIRLEAVGAFAPLLAGAAVLSAVALAVALRGHAPAALLASWVMAVVAAGWIAVRLLARNALGWLGREVPARVGIENGAMLALLAAAWGVVPALAYAHQGGELRVMIAGVAGVLACGALAIATAPVAAAVWAGTLALGIALAATLTRDPHWPALAAAAALDLGFIAAVVGRVSTLAARHAGLVADRDAQAAAAAQLVREYEERGTSCLWQTDAGHAIRYASPAMAAMLGRPASALAGAPLPALVGGHAALGTALAARASFAAIEVELGEPGARRAILFSGTPVADADGGFAGFRGACADVTEARSQERRLRQLAHVDVLTGLPNRMRLRELFADMLLAARADGEPCALLMLDIDGFKPVNDSFGHPAGDALLTTVAARLVAEVGDGGIVGRLGGDEFAVLLPHAGDTERTGALAQRLIACVSEPYALDAGSARVGLSVGIAAAPIDGDTVDAIVKRADLALYEAKAAGRGTWRAFRREMEAVAEDRLRTELDLRRALPLGQLRLCYQPVIRTADRRVVAFEALLRWHHPTRGVVQPAEFLAVAEESGLIEEIGEWVLATAVADCARLPDPVAVAVNLSPLQLRSAQLPARVADALARARLPANRLELEIDERVFAGDPTLPLDVLRRLRAQGVRIALDDFGTGRSSLGALNRAIFTRLKIDGSFVRDAGAREEATAIVRAIVALADCLGMTITAEGVETAEELQQMAALGCHRMQGFLLGRPLPFEHAAALVAGAGYAGTVATAG